MLLTEIQIERFYELMTPLLVYVNERTNTLEPHVRENLEYFFNPKAENELRVALWRNPHLLVDYLHDNPYNFDDEDLTVVANWKNFQFGDFTLCKVIRERGIFLSHDDPQRFYSVIPLIEPFKNLLPEIPIIVRTALIPYQGVIVYDGSMASYGIYFGPGLRAAASDWYIDAYERGLIKTTLPELPLSHIEQEAQRQNANKSILRYFKTYLRRERLSDKIINRDITTVETFADFLTDQIDETASLRAITIDVFEKYLISMRSEIPRPTIVGFRRFFTYLMETDRLDWELAEDLLTVLRNL